jgi:hypothetical protein
MHITEFFMMPVKQKKEGLSDKSALKPLSNYETITDIAILKISGTTVYFCLL